MKLLFTFILITVITVQNFSQTGKVFSPNKKIGVSVHFKNSDKYSGWYLSIVYSENNAYTEVIPKINIGLVRNDQNFSNKLTLKKTGEPKFIKDSYSALHGKKSECSNSANEITVFFENPDKSKFNLIIRAYNDGVAFRYEFPEEKGTYVINDELTSYSIPDSTNRWLEKFDLSNEGLYDKMIDGTREEKWCYPALFETTKGNCWYLIHEAEVNRSYCATKLSNINSGSDYKIALPQPDEGVGEALPTITLPWKSPWRVIMVGNLSEIVSSTLVNDISSPTQMTKTDWIRPGLVSWNYWSDNHGTKDFQTVCKFADLAADMDWPYTLLDWEWDAMENGGNVEDAAKYILSKGVKPLIWYNSSMFKWITATPVDRMKTHENRVEEFTWLKKNGFVGVKIDFFLSEKQYMIDYYLDILEDAAQFEMMVYFHGCLVPRGWARTYPHLMTYEGVRGAEWYNNSSQLTTTAPEHNTILPFTRNVVGSMDYTPVTFTNSQHPHITSYAHELALSVVFESALQHLADRPEGYYNLPDAARSFLKDVFCAWDNTLLLDGYPGEKVIIARQKDSEWFIGGINAENKVKKQTVNFDFLEDNTKYRLVLITDGEHDTKLSSQILVVNNTDSIEIKMLRRGGFAASLKPFE